MENDKIKTGKGMTLKKFVEEILAERIGVETGWIDDEGACVDGVHTNTKNFTDEEIAREAGAQDVKGIRGVPWEERVRRVAAVRKTLEIAKLGKKEVEI